MGSTSYLPSSDSRDASPRRKAVSFGLALIAHLLIAWLLLRLAPSPFEAKPADRTLTTFDVTNADSPRPKGSKAEKASVAADSGAPRKAPEVAPPRPSQPPPVAPPPVPSVPQVALLGGMDLFNAADVSKMHGADAGDGEGSGKGSGKDSASAYGPGEGPGGKRLYEAEWYREPTHAEMATYMPRNFTGGSAMIACQTIPNYRVENCRELGETPVGSGLSRALRQAAWQFRVLPPRINGKQVIGAWVRIRFDYTVKESN
jgi:protein TonB